MYSANMTGGPAGCYWVVHHNKCMPKGMPPSELVRCVPPARVTIGGMVRMFVKYIDDHPEKEHERFDGVVWPAMLKAYPCH